jgi:hypothetical protein
MRDSRKRPREQTGNGMVRPYPCPFGERCWDGASVHRHVQQIIRKACRPANLLARQRRMPMVRQANESSWCRAIRSEQETVRVLTIMRADKKCPLHGASLFETVF